MSLREWKDMENERHETWDIFSSIINWILIITSQADPNTFESFEFRLHTVETDIEMSATTFE